VKNSTSTQFMIAFKFTVNKLLHYCVTLCGSVAREMRVNLKMK